MGGNEKRKSSSDTPSVVEQFLVVMHHVHLMKAHCAERAIPMPAAVAMAIAEAEGWRLRAEEFRAWALEDKKDESRGVKPPDGEPQRIAESGLPAAWGAHAKLCELVAPATPESIEWTTATADTTPGRQRWSFVIGMIVLSVAILTFFVLALYDVAGRRAANTTGDPVMAKAASSVLSIERMQAAMKGSPTVEEIAAVKHQATTGGDALRALLKRPVPDPVPASWEQQRDFYLDTAETLDRIAAGPKDDGELTQIDDASRMMWGLLSDQNLRGALPDYLMLVLAGMLGATFYNLYYAHQHITNRTFCAAYVQRYLIRIILGAVSGLVLGHFGGDVMQQYANGSGSATVTFSRAFLALLGGYTVEAVNLMFTRVAEALSTLFRGTFSELVEAKQAEITAKAEKSKAELRLTLSRQLESLRPELGGKTTRLDEILKSLQE